MTTETTQITTPRLINKKTAAEMLDCSTRTIERLIHSQEWRTVALGTRGTRIVAEDVEAFINGQIARS